MVPVLSSALMTPRLKSKRKKMQNKNCLAEELQETACEVTFYKKEKAFLKSTIKFEGFKRKSCISVTVSYSVTASEI